MLKGSGLCVCLLLYCNAVICAEEDTYVDSTEKSQPHPRYLKELFPFLQKVEQTEEIKPLLTGIKRKRRVCHHGNLKRGSHVVHFRPTSDVKTLHFPNRAISLTSVSKFAPSKEKRHITLGDYAGVLARKIREGNKENKKTKKAVATHSTIKASTTKYQKPFATQLNKTTNGMKSSHSSSATTEHGSNHTTTHKKVSKRIENENKRAIIRGMGRQGIKKRSQVVVENIANEGLSPISEDDKISIMSSNALLQPAYIPMMGVIKPTIVPSFTDDDDIDMMPTLNERSLSLLHTKSNRKDPPNGSLTMDLEEFDMEKREKGLIKRESGEPKKKTVKSVITKILIIPVERQIEEAGEEIPEEIDVVSLKHSRDFKKKHFTKQHKTPSTALPANLSTVTASSAPTEMEFASDNTSCADTTAPTFAEILITESPKTHVTTCPSSTHKSTKVTTCKSSTCRISRQTTKRRTSTRAAGKPITSTTTEATSTVLNLSVSVCLGKESDSTYATDKANTDATTERKQQSSVNS